MRRSLPHPTQHRPHLRRRPRLEGRRLPGQRFHGDAQHRPAWRRRAWCSPPAMPPPGNCAPSRACLLSGTYTPRHHVYAVGSTDRGPKTSMRLVPIPNKSGLAKENVTIADALKAAGYVTGIFGKWHLDGKDGAEPARAGIRRRLSILSVDGRQQGARESQRHLLAHPGRLRVHGEEQGPALSSSTCRTTPFTPACRRASPRWRSSRRRRRASSTTTRCTPPAPTIWTTASASC